MVNKFFPVIKTLSLLILTKEMTRDRLRKEETYLGYSPQR